MSSDTVHVKNPISATHRTRWNRRDISMFVLVAVAIALNINMELNVLLATCRPTEGNDERTEASTPTRVAPAKGSLAVHEASGCSCWNSTAGPDCCLRILRKAHKMGHMLITRKIYRYLTKKYGKKQIQSPAHFFEGVPQYKVDYREVIVTRNIYTALASGYLYHKSGNECWLNQNGGPLRRKGMFTENHEKWESFVRVDDPHRNEHEYLCSYLAKESEEDGLRIYIDFVFNAHYKQLVDHRWRLSQSIKGRDKILFLCYEDLTNNATDQATLNYMMDWFFPGGHERWKGPSLSQPYSGGHATSHDKELRDRLTKQIMKLDRKVFNGTIASFNLALPCGESGQQ